MSELVSDWAENNHKNGITSFLIRLEGHFLQLLEGPPRLVSGLMDRIWDDGRHGEVEILLTGHDNRHFSNGHALGFADLVRSAEGARFNLSNIADACPAICRDSPLLHDWLSANAAAHPLLMPR